MAHNALICLASQVTQVKTLRTATGIRNSRWNRISSSMTDNQDTPENTPDVPDDVTEPPDIRDQDLETNSQAELDSLQPEHVTNDGEINSWVEMEQPNFMLARVAETELEKMRLDMELTMLKCQYEEKEKQRQHKEKMEQMRLQASSGHPAEGCLDLLMPQNQFALFLYCFIFIHVIYTARDLLLFFAKKHHLFIIVVTLLYLIKKLWDYLCCS
ncbi:transmembrane protein 247 isoform X1 [Chelonia mydas]|uniref:transmembrane protein 247 isoform X1 n=2 Tax=Chelonia mydas TaxID=8469 RepID=UPI0018A1D3C1|nr:transmembrane protein 247 isoform X1 [Chelonia mydas]